jgi:hypothetical protein
MEYIEPQLADRSRPSEGRRDGGASRDGNCSLIKGETHLMALVPARTEYIKRPDEFQAAAGAEESSALTYQSVLSLTDTSNPVLWFYLPYALNGRLSLEFVLQDETSNTLYQTEVVPEVEGPGILSVPFPATVSLSRGERHNWYLVAQCNHGSNLYVEGWIERIALPAMLQQQLAAASPRERATLYAANGIWQDALTLVAERYYANPQDPEAQADWASLLTSIDFEEPAAAAIIESPILDCCGSHPAAGLSP